MTIPRQETDLYLPIKQFLETRDYRVKGEIKDCDIVAVKNSGGDEQILIIELKLKLNITLLMQAVERFTLSDDVYIAIPKNIPIYKKKSKQVKKLIARLGIGLIIVDIQKSQSYVEVVCNPKDYQPRKNKPKQKALLKEFSTRIGDTQEGGATRKKGGLTAYRQRTIRVAQYLNEYHQATGAEIHKNIIEKQANSILYQNYYGWFDKIQRGVYGLSKTGKEELIYWLAIQKNSN
ncbi:DUF2161 family putative PD-(D/E)XK-type phosphodiesterase [Psychromonas sp. MME2]|uniref:DUF2161 family putative PD-(D/E)XK-type phosphodiesterase n=1 Tax=Psychromonas sp. MME2 TaxID=3231033 RepID=UPI00339C09B8